MTTDAEIIEAMARAEVDPGDGTIKPDLKYVLIRGFHAMGWERPADATINMIEAAFAICAPAVRERCAENWFEERLRLRALLDACHDHMHELTAIIPGNDRAYDLTTDLMGDIREELASALPLAGLPAAPAESAKCETCNGHGQIGGFSHAEASYWSEQCPDCKGTGRPAPAESKGEKADG